MGIIGDARRELFSYSEIYFVRGEGKTGGT